MAKSHRRKCWWLFILTKFERTNEMANVASLFRSRKFWLMIMDTVISLSLWFVGRNIPGAMEDTKFIIGILQPVFVALIGAFAYEDAALAGKLGVRQD